MLRDEEVEGQEGLAAPDYHRVRDLLRLVVYDYRVRLHQEDDFLALYLEQELAGNRVPVNLPADKLRRLGGVQVERPAQGVGAYLAGVNPVLEVGHLVHPRLRRRAKRRGHEYEHKQSFQHKLPLSSSLTLDSRLLTPDSRFSIFDFLFKYY